MRLHRLYCEAGGDSSTFWSETPRLIRSFINAYAERMKLQERLAMKQAWNIAALPLQKRFPPLAEFLGDKAPPKYLTPSEFVAVMKRAAKTNPHLKIRRIEAGHQAISSPSPHP